MTTSARPCRTGQAEPSRATEDGVIRHRPNRGACPSPRAAHSTCTSPLWQPQTSPPSTPQARPEQVQERTSRRCRWQTDPVALLKRSRSRAILSESCSRVFLLGSSSRAFLVGSRSRAFLLEFFPSLPLRVMLPLPCQRLATLSRDRMALAAS